MPLLSTLPTVFYQSRNKQQYNRRLPIFWNGAQLTTVFTLYKAFPLSEPVHADAVKCWWRFFFLECSIKLQGGKKNLVFCPFISLNYWILWTVLTPYHYTVTEHFKESLTIKQTPSEQVRWNSEAVVAFILSWFTV